jgi:threonine aldolase
MEFSSDGASWGAPKILERLGSQHRTSAPIFDQDEATASLRKRVCDVFECEADIYPVVTGTAANGIALATLTPPHGAIVCHQDSHLLTDECSAPEMFTGGARLVGLEGEHGKIDPVLLQRLLDHSRFGVSHSIQPKALSVAQVNEAGTVYTVDEVRGLVDIARGAGLKIHMDGARLSNAIAALGCSPAEITWKSGVDILSLGANKNGALAAEAIVVFDRSLSETLRYVRKRSGHFVAKTLLLSLQLDAYLTDDLWLDNGRHANGMARRLVAAFQRHPDIRLIHPPEANEIFFAAPDGLLDHLTGNGVRLYRNWRTFPQRYHRMVTSFANTPDEIDQVIKLVDEWTAKERAA